MHKLHTSCAFSSRNGSERILFSVFAYWSRKALKDFAQKS